MLKRADRRALREPKQDASKYDDPQMDFFGWWERG
jgi:hypothetical protein